MKYKFSDILVRINNADNNHYLYDYIKYYDELFQVPFEVLYYETIFNLTETY